MKCQTKNNLAGILDLETCHIDGAYPSGVPGGIRRLVCCDQELVKAQSNNCESTTDAVGNQILECLNASGLRNSPSKPRLSFLALAGSVSVSNTILVESQFCQELGRQSVTCYSRATAEKRSTFFCRVWKDMNEKMKPVIVPNYEFAEHVNEGDVLLVLGGELECSDVQLMVRQNRQLLQSNGVLCVGNVRSNQEIFDEIVLEGVGKPMYISSTNTGDIMTSLSSIVEKCLIKRKEGREGVGNLK